MTLDVTDALLSLAEVAAAFAGFAVLVSVLRKRGSCADTLHDILRLRIVISTSMVVVVASLIPVALANFYLPDRLVWDISAGILLLLNYGILLSFIRSYQPVKDKFRPDHFAVSVVSSLELMDQLAFSLTRLRSLPSYPVIAA